MVDFFNCVLEVDTHLTNNVRQNVRINVFSVAVCQYVLLSIIVEAKYNSHLEQTLLKVYIGVKIKIS